MQIDFSVTKYECVLCSSFKVKSLVEWPLNFSHKFSFGV